MREDYSDDGNAVRLEVRSVVGLLPLCAATETERKTVEQFPTLLQRVRRFLAVHPEVTATIAPFDRQGHNGRHLPGESTTGMFGGNSNWRGPIWMPVNLLAIRGSLSHCTYLGKRFTVECPVGSGREMNLYEVAAEIARRLTAIFLRDASGKRPVFGAADKFQTDPHWRDHLLYYEYFHGDTGAGLGASHQTGWAGIVARLIQLFGVMDADTYLETGAGLRVAYQEED